MRINHTLKKLKEGTAVFGCAIQQYGSAEIARAFAAAGFDYVFIDAEHGGFGLETIQNMINSAVQSGITPVVRVADLQYALIARILDLGAQGIILPRVEAPDLLEQAVSWTKYPPLGRRGFGVMDPQLDYETQSMEKIVEHLNANTMVVVQFETRQAMENADDLLSVKGIDVAMVGPTDLSISLGVQGEFEHPRLVQTVVQFIERCQKHRVIPGIHCRDVVQARKWLERGMRLVGAGGEHRLLFQKARETVAELKAAAGVAAYVPKD
ncbi:MAG TPA: aldolase/citrate lyase family protein [Terriglobia bacterium]|nr:aldolase/citrate lyase family protein [Terriglobia bacterium]